MSITSTSPETLRSGPCGKFEATAQAIIDEALRPETSWRTGPGEHSSERDKRWGSLAHDLVALFQDDHQWDMFEAEVFGCAYDNLSETQTEIVGELWDLISSVGRVPAVKHKWFRLVCARCSDRKDRRGELGLVVRCTCALKLWSPASLAVWLWRDGDARGALHRLPADPSKAPDRRLDLRCRACSATPAVNLRRLVAKLDQLRRETLRTVTPGRPTVLLVDRGGRFGFGGTPEIPAIGSRAARERHPVPTSTMGRAPIVPL